VLACVLINSYDVVNEATQRPEEERNHEDERTVTSLQLREKLSEEDNLTPSQIKLADKFLIKCQTRSDALQGITAKFMHVFEGPYIVSQSILPSSYKLSDSQGKIRGECNIKALKPYLEESTAS
jgi:hypothetical protein